MDILLAPPIAFIFYLILVGVLSGMGRVLAGPSHQTPLKASIYASGEAPPTHRGLPGYRPFFVVALFFAVLHLGVLVLATSGLSPLAGIYLVGLILVLLALSLG
jgi:NADH:ubiquinone oxidoreductase subunit 3 (subunit A)